MEITEYVYLIRHLIMQYFGEPTGQAKIQRTSKNIQLYLLSNCSIVNFVNISEQTKAAVTLELELACL